MFKAFAQNGTENGIIMVKGVPFGSPSDRDTHGQFFSENTDFLADMLPLPPVFHHHGAKTGSMTSPIAETLSREPKEDGIWYKIKLHLDSVDDMVRQKASTLWEAAKDGKLFASSGAVEAAIKIASNGEILQWLVGEISLINTENPRERPANFHATAIPVKMAESERSVESGVIKLESLKFIESDFITPEADKEDKSNLIDIKRIQEIIAGTYNKIIKSNPSLLRSNEMPDELTPAQSLAQLQVQVAELTAQLTTVGAQVQDRDNRIDALQNIVTTKSAEVEMKNHEGIVDGWISEGLLSPAERDAALNVMSFAFQADTTTKGDTGFVNAVTSWVALRPKNPLVGPPASVFNNTGATLAQTAGGTVDPENIERMKRYADLS